MINHSIKTGFSFGLTSGIITTLGLMVGLNASTNSKIAVVGGVLIIAIADAFSDSLGIHVSEESENKHTPKEIWQSTLSTFVAKFFVALSFVVPVLLFPLQTAVLVAVAWGLSLLAIFSYSLAKTERINPASVIAEHLIIAVVVLLIAYYFGGWVRATFV